jgi:hypothetical protein
MVASYPQAMSNDPSWCRLPLVGATSDCWAAGSLILDAEG